MLLYQKVIIHPDWRGFFDTHQLNDFTTIYGLRGGTLVQSSRSNWVRRFYSVSRFSLLDNGHATTLYLKRSWLLQPTKKGMFRGTFFGSAKAKREYDFLLQLREHGLDAPLPLAYGEERSSRWLLRSFLITEGIREPLALDEFITQELPTLPRRQRGAIRLELMTRLATTIARMHGQRLVHGDLYWRNVVLSRPRVGRLFFLDAPKGHRFMALCGRRRRAKDLATLDAPAPAYFRRTERLRFLLCYLGETRLTPAGKRFARLVLRLADRERKQQIRRLRGVRPEKVEQVVGL